MKNAKKRILFIITQAEWGGAQNYVFKASREARDRGYEVLVTAGGEGALESRCKEIQIPYQKLLKLKRNIEPIADIQATGELISIIKSWKPDIVFLFSAKAGIVGSIAGKIAGVKKIVYRIGGWSWLDPVSNTQKQFRIWSERLVAPFKDVIIVQHPGDKTEAEIHHVKPRKEIAVISNGLDTRAFDQALLPRDEARRVLEELWQRGTNQSVNESMSQSVGEDDRRQTTDDRKTLQFAHTSHALLVTIANFYATKDLSNFLQSAKLVSESHPEARFMIMGDGGDQREKIHELRRALHLEQIVSFPGAVNNAQTLLRGADLFISSSAKEGNPWTIHEAMASRLPCVATDVGACAWLLQNNAGWIVPSKNPKALSEATVYALDHPEEAREQSDRARRNVETIFTEKNMWEKTFEVLEG